MSIWSDLIFAGVTFAFGAAAFYRAIQVESRAPRKARIVYVMLLVVAVLMAIIEMRGFALDELVRLAPLMGLEFAVISLLVVLLRRK